MEQPDAAVLASSLTAPEAFGTLFDRHGAALLRFLARRVPPAEADDLLGEVFRIAFERRASFDRTRASARPWLYGIAANVLAKHRRSEGRRLRATAQAAARGRPGGDPADRTVQALDARARLTQVTEALALLPSAERQVLLLFTWEELSYQDIADALTIPVGTVRSRLNRARTHLTAALDGTAPTPTAAAPTPRRAP